jgi:hypothetical protein
MEMQCVFCEIGTEFKWADAVVVTKYVDNLNDGISLRLRLVFMGSEIAQWV